MDDLVNALGLVLVIEGVLYAGAPAAMKKGLRQVLAVPDSTIRLAGLAAMALGVGIVWLVRG